MIAVDPIGPATVCDETMICDETTLVEDGPVFLGTQDGTVTSTGVTPGTVTLTPAS